MKKFYSFILCLCPIMHVFSQNLNWDGSVTGTKTSDYNTSVQVAQIGWGSHHGILFNAYRSPTLVNGFLSDLGNTKHSFDVGPYSSGAGAIMYLGNGGRLDFLISDNSTGAGSNVAWGAPKMSIARNSNVGIGNTSPSFRFHIQGGNPNSDLMTLGSNTTGNFALTDAGGGAYGLFAGVSNTGRAWLQAGRYDTNVAYDLILQASGGKVGIGTTAPASMLSIKGDYGINIEPYSGGTTNFYITSNSADNIVGVNARTKYGSWEIPDTSKPSSFVDFSTYNINNPYYGGIAFFTRSGGASGIGTEKIVLLNNGNVGIGNANPDAKLAVSGQVHAQEVKVSVTVPGPDYVFEKDYKLTSLEDIKTYIDQNKHLPEVPSAKEMEKNGVQLGEMNMLLLKKIEELTLYVIELKKRDEAQQNEIEVLKNKK